MSGREKDCGCGCVARVVAGSRLAKRMRDAIRESLGFTSCAGVSNSKVRCGLLGPNMLLNP